MTDAGVAAAVSQLIDDPGALSVEGHLWSLEVGLAHVLPAGALQCQPIAECTGRDNLRPSTSGGPPLTTHKGLLVAPAPPCGFGVFVTQTIPKGTVLGEYTGEVRSYDVWCEEIKSRKLHRRSADISVPFIREELYAAWAGNGPAGAGVVVDAFAKGNTMRFINCSCKPNCSFKAFGQGIQRHSRLRVITLREISPWEQLSVDYGWYYDDATLKAVKAQAVEAFNNDIPALQALHLEFPGEGSDRGLQKTLTHSSEAVLVIFEALREAKGPPLPVRSAPRSFLRRYVDSEGLAKCFGTLDGVHEVQSHTDIPGAIWHLYEVVGAGLVGIPCRCGLDKSLNVKGVCSGIIGRPLQSVLNGQNDDVA